MAQRPIILWVKVFDIISVLFEQENKKKKTLALSVELNIFSYKLTSRLIKSDFFSFMEWTSCNIWNVQKIYLL